MFPPRLSILRIPPLLRPFRPPNTCHNLSKLRLFTHNSQLLLISPASPRPQLPFLYTPAGLRPIRARNGVNLQLQVSRLLTTERKKYIKEQVWLASKWTAYGWSAFFLLSLMIFGFNQERLERKFPSPSEWKWMTRRCWRDAKGQELLDSTEDGITDWANCGSLYRELIRRLEDPSIDGSGLQESEEGGILVAGVGKTGLDITGKSEPWRRGYYEILMGAARTAEHLDGFLLDRTRRIVFPPEVVKGPSNPRPKPVPRGAHAAPLEENCEPASDPPETFYMKILTTAGFSTRQRLDAALGYADWLNYKNLPQSAEEMYDWGLDIAMGALPTGADNVVDTKTGVINADKASFVTSNILLATTSLAIHHAQTGNLSTALPILLSVLRARRSLPNAPPRLRFSIPTEENVQPTTYSTIVSLLRSLMVSPPYPPQPPSGNELPVRDSKAICDEAGLMANIGEILFASSPSSREAGLGWTRDAVDMAETTFGAPNTDSEGRKRCQECLEVGLDNWRKMVGKLVVAENTERETKRAKSGWFGMGTKGKGEGEGRWAQEERVVEERMKRLHAVQSQQRLENSGGGVLLFG